VKEKYLGPPSAAKIRVTVDAFQRATIRFFGFPCGNFAMRGDVNRVLDIATPDGQSIKTFIGGRDDASSTTASRRQSKSLLVRPESVQLPETPVSAAWSSGAFPSLASWDQDCRRSAPDASARLDGMNALADARGKVPGCHF
jgi:hypothetical protein